MCTYVDDHKALSCEIRILGIITFQAGEKTNVFIFVVIVVVFLKV